MSEIANRIRSEANMSSRSGQCATLHSLADQVENAEITLVEDKRVMDRQAAALSAVLALHTVGPGSTQGYTKGGYGYISPYCVGCEAYDEYGVEWPCKTVRAITDVIGGAS